MWNLINEPRVAGDVLQTALSFITKLQIFQGGATLQLSLNSKTNLRALTWFFKENAPYFGSIEVEGYIMICMCQIFQKVALSTFFFLYPSTF